MRIHCNSGEVERQAAQARRTDRRTLAERCCAPGRGRERERTKRASRNRREKKRATKDKQWSVRQAVGAIPAVVGGARSGAMIGAVWIWLSIPMWSLSCPRRGEGLLSVSRIFGKRRESSFRRLLSRAPQGSAWATRFPAGCGEQPRNFTTFSSSPWTILFCHGTIRV